MPAFLQAAVSLNMTLPLQIGQSSAEQKGKQVPFSFQAL